MRRLLLIPATLAVLVLGACGKDKDPAAATASAGSAGAGRIDSWSIVGPLVAGSQASGCTSLAQGGQAAAFTLAIDASGKLTGSGAEIDMRQARSVQLLRERAGDIVKVSAALSIDPNKGPTLALNDEGGQRGAGAVFMAGDEQLHCTEGKPLDQLRAQPLYKAMARVMEAPAPRLSCMDLATKMSITDTAFKVANGIVTLGSETFDLSQAKHEQLMLAPQDDVVSYAFELPGKPVIYLAYDPAGKLLGVQGGGAGNPTHACHVDA